MRILFCSDGSIQAENAIRFGALIAAACQAEATILQISESASEEPALAQALERVQHLVEGKALRVEVISRTGRPVQEILNQTLRTNYDLVLIGAARKRGRGAFSMSAKAYEIIRAIQPPVLAVIGARAQLQKILLCTGGRDYIDAALDLIGRIARGTGATVTLLHVLAQPPSVYASLVARQENADWLFNSSLPLGRNLKHEKETLTAMGVNTEVRLCQGEVTPEVLRELRGEQYDLVVAGCSSGRGPIQSYIMGDIARELVNQAERPVLVIRTAEASRQPVSFARLLSGVKRTFVTGKDS